MNIGPYELPGKVLAAPMAGVTDRPFRQLCKQFGAALAVSEMVTSKKHLYHTQKTQRRLDHAGEAEPRSVQIAGSIPEEMAEAARFNVDHGAQIIDINMGCPAKKVCNRLAGSALLKDEKLVGDILDAVVQAVNVPVTLKTRTGWAPDHKNGVRVAKMAEQAGIQALTVHGRTRACAYRGEAEYDTIAEIKSAINIPLIANGDITSPEKAREVLHYTGADAIMIGRGAQGQPWVFREIEHFLETGQRVTPLAVRETASVIMKHLEALYAFYGDELGVRIARKHLRWYLSSHPRGDTFWKCVNKIEDAELQYALAYEFFIIDTL
ncbi:MAG: tRNA dihydrouridine synthase DusB [Pseudomonadota bacterium]